MMMNETPRFKDPYRSDAGAGAGEGGKNQKAGTEHVGKRKSNSKKQRCVTREMYERRCEKFYPVRRSKPDNRRPRSTIAHLPRG